ARDLGASRRDEHRLARVTYERLEPRAPAARFVLARPRAEPTAARVTLEHDRTDRAPVIHLLEHQDALLVERAAQRNEGAARVVEAGTGRDRAVRFDRGVDICAVELTAVVGLCDDVGRDARQ